MFIGVPRRSNLGGRRPVLPDKNLPLVGGQVPEKLPENRFFITRIFGVLPE